MHYIAGFLNVNRHICPICNLEIFIIIFAQKVCYYVNNTIHQLVMEGFIMKMRDITIGLVCLVIAGCSSKTQVLLIDDIEIQVTQMEVKPIPGAYSIDPLTNNFDPEPITDLIEVLIFGSGTSQDVDALEKIGDWEVQLFDDSGQEFKLNDINLTYQNATEGEEGIQFQLQWMFIGYIRSDFFSFHLPNENVVSFLKTETTEK